MAFILTTLIVTPLCSLFAQSDSARHFEIGPLAGYSYGLQFGQFPIYNGSPECGLFSNGTTTAPWLGAVLQWPRLFDPRVGLSARLGWSVATSRFTAPPVEIQRTVDTSTHRLDTIDREFRLDATAATLSIDLLARLDIAGRWGIYLGPSFGYRFERRVRQTDNVTEPNRSFANGERSLDMRQGTPIQLMPFTFGGVVAASVALPLGPRATLVPEISIRGDITTGVAGTNWRRLSAGGGLGLLFDLSGRNDSTPPPPPVDTIVADTSTPIPPALAATIRIHGIDENDRLSPEAVISVREVIFRQHTPFLPTIYFNQGSAAIPARYAQLTPSAVSQFSYLSVAELGPLELSHWTLNLVGLRMREDRSARLTLYGSATEDETPRLATERAENVRDYLTENWGITRSRIEIRTGAGSFPFSDAATAEGRDENRRVIFASNNPYLLAPISTERIVRDFNPPMVKLDPTIEAEAGVLNWSVALMQGADTLATFIDVDSSTTARSSISWRLLDNRIDSTLGRLVALLQVEDSAGQVVLARDSIALTIRRDSQIVDGGREQQGVMERISYALVAFGYRSDVGDKTHENWLREMAELLKPGAEIRITGYTDRIGDDRYNLELSQGRADYVAGRLRSLAAQRGIRDIRIEARGVGVETGRFPNELPEGRILSRGATVIIEQRTE